MIKTGTCKICDQVKVIYDSLAIDDVCARCLEEAACKVRRHWQRIAAVESGLPDATLRIFDAIIAVDEENDGGPMTLAEIGDKADRVKSAVGYQVDRLAAAGLVRRDKGLARTIRLVKEPQTTAFIEEGQ